ncbi:MAG: zinc-dependent alcohol dehydrogenase [Pseudonocardiaceae bacterium]
MRALVFQEPGDVALQARPVPSLDAPDHVRVRVVGTGICGTDRKILLGLFPAKPGVILGHESVGVVDVCGSGVSSLTEGDRVVIDPTLYCGLCGPCRRGATNFCHHKRGTEVGVDRDGTFADYVVLPERFFHRIPKPLTVREAVLIEPLACVLNNLRAASLSYDDVVVILGAGPIGTLCGLVAGRAARRVVVTETDRYRLAAATAGFQYVIDVSEGYAAEAVHTATGGARPSVVIDTTGTGLETALALVDDGGRVVVMGFNSTYRATVSPLQLTNRGISIIGAGDYRAEIFPVAVNLAAELALADIVTHEYSLDRYPDAFAALGETLPGVVPDPPATRGYAAMKVLIRCYAGELDAHGWPADLGCGS